MSHSTMEQQTDRGYSYPPVTEELLGEIVQRILSAGSPLKIILFGSRARGDNKPDSDIDILIIEASDAHLSDKRRAYDKVLYDLYPEKTVLAHSILDVEQWKYVRGYITTEALEQGKVLYEDPKRLTYAQKSVEQAMRVAEEPEYKTPEDHARLWFKKGGEDLFVCELLLEHKAGYATACFHAQQAAEKYLKGFLAVHQHASEKTHDLEHLTSECLKVCPITELSALDLKTMTEYAIKGRYDGRFWPARDEAEGAYRLALRVRETILAHIPLEAMPDSPNGRPPL